MTQRTGRLVQVLQIYLAARRLADRGLDPALRKLAPNLKVLNSILSLSVGGFDWTKPGEIKDFMILLWGNLHRYSNNLVEVN